MSFVMTVEERETFLSDLHVGVLSVQADGRGPVTVPVWYAYEPGGEIRFVTSKASRKAILLAAAGRCTLCVQDEQSPYRYVSVEGPIVAMEEGDRERDLGPIARRYLGEEGGNQYLAETSGSPAEVLVRIRPERWSSADYGKSP